MKQLILFLLVSLPFFKTFAQQNSKTKEPKIYTYVAQMPEFPGGPDSMRIYLGNHIRYPQEALINSQEGIAFISFVVDSLGKISKPEVVKSAAPSLDAEAIRVISDMPRWKPGKQNGQPVAVKFTLPVRFQFAHDVPRYPGGKEALIAFLAKNMQYPSEAVAKNIEGEVIISFTVQENGELGKYKIEKSPHQSLTTETMRLLELMPNWEPANPKGSPVAMRHAISIPFTIDRTPESYINISSVKDAAEKMPEFPGGNIEMQKFLTNNVKYPLDALKEEIDGLAVVRFVIDSTGTIHNIETAKSIYPSIDAEARRVVSIMPRWQPGSQFGTPVNVRYTLPIRFKLGYTDPAQKPNTPENYSGKQRRIH